MFLLLCSFFSYFPFIQYWQTLTRLNQFTIQAQIFPDSVNIVNTNYLFLINESSFRWWNYLLIKVCDEIHTHKLTMCSNYTWILVATIETAELIFLYIFHHLWIQSILTNTLPILECPTSTKTYLLFVLLRIRESFKPNTKGKPRHHTGFSTCLLLFTLIETHYFPLNGIISLCIFTR